MGVESKALDIGADRFGEFECCRKSVIARENPLREQRNLHKRTDLIEKFPLVPKPGVSQPVRTARHRSPRAVATETTFRAGDKASAIGPKLVAEPQSGKGPRGW